MVFPVRSFLTRPGPSKAVYYLVAIRQWTGKELFAWS